MPVFTLELKKVAALFPEDQGLNVYPVYDGAPNGFRAELNKKILDHFWNREICMESVSMWRFNMRRKMNEIMPYYNQLYKSELINIDPISTMNIAGKSKADSTQENESTQASTATDAQNSTSEQNSTSAQNSTSKTVASDYPQTALDENDGSQYATNSQQSVGAGTGAGSASESRVTNDTRNENGTASQNGVATQNGETTTVGYTGAPSDLLMRYRASFLNIDMMVISDLEELFMTVWDNGDSYTNGNY